MNQSNSHNAVMVRGMIAAAFLHFLFLLLSVPIKGWPTPVEFIMERDVILPAMSRWFDILFLPIMILFTRIAYVFIGDPFRDDRHFDDMAFRSTFLGVYLGIFIATIFGFFAGIVNGIVFTFYSITFAYALCFTVWLMKKCTPPFFEALIRWVAGK